MGNGNGKTRLIIYVVLAAITIIIALKAWILLPEQVTVQAAQNTLEHNEMKEDIETLDDEAMALVIDVVTIKTNVNNIITEQGRQEQRQAERHVEIINKIKELHR